MTSVDIQLMQDEEGRRPYLTHWSRHEAASIRRPAKGNTDHWTKTKHKNVTFATCGRDDNVHTFPGVRYPHEQPASESAKWTHCGYNIDGTMKHVGTQSFTSLLIANMEGNWPGNYHSTRPSTRRRIVRSVFNERARDGFEYWWKEPKPLSASGKKWIGSGVAVCASSMQPQTAFISRLSSKYKKKLPFKTDT